MAHVGDKGAEEPKLEDIPVIRKYPEVYPEDLPELSPQRQDESSHRFDSRRCACSRCTLATYTSEMQELAVRPQKLMEEEDNRPKIPFWETQISAHQKGGRNFQIGIDYQEPNELTHKSQ